MNASGAPDVATPRKRRTRRGCRGGRRKNTTTLQPPEEEQVLTSSPVSVQESPSSPQQLAAGDLCYAAAVDAEPETAVQPRGQFRVGSRDNTHLEERGSVPRKMRAREEHAERKAEKAVVKEDAVERQGRNGASSQHVVSSAPTAVGSPLVREGKNDARVAGPEEERDEEEVAQAESTVGHGRSESEEALRRLRGDLTSFVMSLHSDTRSDVERAIWEVMLEVNGLRSVVEELRSAVTENSTVTNASQPLEQPQGEVARREEGSVPRRRRGRVVGGVWRVLGRVGRAGLSVLVGAGVVGLIRRRQLR